MEPEKLLQLIQEANAIIEKSSHKRKEVETNLSKILRAFLKNNYTDTLKSKVITDLKKYHPKAIPQLYRIEVPVFMLTEKEGRMIFQITKMDDRERNISLEYSFQINDTGAFTFSNLLAIMERA